MADEKELREQEMIQREYDALLEDYLNSNHRRHVEIIEQAFLFAKQAHKGITRLSGEPYIMHPLAVARIVVKEIGLGSTSVCAALLHDVVEDTDYTVEDIASRFGDKIASIVDGLTKISGDKFADYSQGTAENLRKLLFTMADDARVILIKLADRLHNMRTLTVMRPAKQQKIIGETEFIYIPLAHRIGLFRIKTELENLCFKYEDPEEYQKIQTTLDDSNLEREELYQRFAETISAKLTMLGFNFNLKKRVKSVYSIWKKMKTKHIPFEEIFDILAVRIIIEPKEDPLSDEKNQCFNVYSAVTSLYKPHPDRLRDWLSSPKSNGYESLQQTLMVEGQWVEVQIRTKRMDDIAERGLAAHWLYKTGEQQTELDKWLRTIREEVLENPAPNAVDFLDTFKLNMFADEIFVFTPKGEMKIIPQGATVLDFAFSLHTDLGMQCIGAKVNQKLVALSHVLQGGDQVEILTSKKQQPQEDWFHFVSTARAHNKITAYFRRAEKIMVSHGRRSLEAELKKNDIRHDVAVNKILNYFDLKKKEDLYLKIAKNEIPVEGIWQTANKPTKKTEQSAWTKYWKLQFFKSNKKNKSGVDNAPAKPINRNKKLQLSENNYQIAGCCQPIPGDKIVCFMNDEGQIKVHKTDCPIAAQLKVNYGNQIVEAEWTAQDKYSFPATIVFRGIDEVGILAKVLGIISEQKVNLTQINSQSKDGVFEGKLQICIQNLQDLNKLTAQIAKTNGIMSVQRVDNQQKQKS